MSMTHRTDCESLRDVRGNGPCTCAPRALTREQVEDILNKLKPLYVLQSAIDKVLDHDAALRQALAKQAQELEQHEADWHQHSVWYQELANEVALAGTPLPENGEIAFSKLREVVRALSAHSQQQAQEVERLEQNYQSAVKGRQEFRTALDEARQQLVAMKDERDEACGELLVSLDDAPIGSLAGKLVTANRVLRSQLAASRAQYNELTKEGGELHSLQISNAQLQTTLAERERRYELEA